MSTGCHGRGQRISGELPLIIWYSSISVNIWLRQEMDSCRLSSLLCQYVNLKDNIQPAGPAWPKKTRSIRLLKINGGRMWWMFTSLDKSSLFFSPWFTSYLTSSSLNSFPWINNCWFCLARLCKLDSIKTEIRLQFFISLFAEMNLGALEYRTQWSNMEKQGQKVTEESADGLDVTSCWLTGKKTTTSVPPGSEFLKPWHPEHSQHQGNAGGSNLDLVSCSWS